jgi:hypothetical protein
MTDTVALAIVAAVPATIAAIGVIFARREVAAVGGKVEAVHIEVNHRLTQLLEARTAADHAAGVVAGRAASVSETTPPP